MKVALKEPAGTVTLAGTVALALLLDSDTTAPPAGAPLLSVTVASEELPPVTVVGLSVSELTVAETIAIDKGLLVKEEVPKTAVIVIDADNDDETVFTVKVAFKAPSDTATLTGTVAEVLLLDSATMIPPVVAGPDNVTGPSTGFPPTTSANDSVKDASVIDAGAVIVSELLSDTPP